MEKNSNIESPEDENVIKQRKYYRQIFERIYIGNVKQRRKIINRMLN